MSETKQERWQDAERDIWRHEAWDGKRVTVRANADLLNALEQERDELRAKAALYAETLVALFDGFELRPDFQKRLDVPNRLGSVPEWNRIYREAERVVSLIQEGK